jgi:hypothetical protein
MKLIIMILLPGVLTFQGTGEKVLSIKENSAGIRGKMFNSIYKQDELQLDSLVSILNLNLLEFYKLKNLYNSDSRRKEYIESDDYKIRYLKLDSLRNRLLAKTYYLDFEPDYLAERSIGLIYNPEKKACSVSNDISLSVFCDKPGYLQFDQILFKCPEGIIVSERNVNYSCVDVIEETISFRTDNETLASEIDRKNVSLRLLFVFNITGLVSTKGKAYNLTSSDYSVITELHKVIVYDSKTNEVFAVFR